MLLGVGNAFSISVLAAIFDVLPLLGVSTLFVPWIIYLFLRGEYVAGVMVDRPAGRHLDRPANSRTENYRRFARRFRLHDAVFHDRLLVVVRRRRPDLVAGADHSDQGAV